MPQFPTCSQIAGGEIPSYEDFREAKKLFASLLAKDEQVIYACCYGSSSRGGENCLSDIDVFIVYKGRTLNFMLSLRDFFQEKLRGIPVNFELMVFKEDHLRLGLHNFSGTVFHDVKYSSLRQDLMGYCHHEKFRHEKFNSLKIGKPIPDLGGFFASKHSGRFKGYPSIIPKFNDEVREYKLLEYNGSLARTQISILRAFLCYKDLLPTEALNSEKIVYLYRNYIGNDVLKEYRWIHEISQSVLASLEDWNKGEGGSGVFYDREYQELHIKLFKSTPYVLEFIEKIQKEVFSR
jgi:predicted nucleotidyltransferase